jgi:hypothetical protein
MKIVSCLILLKSGVPRGRIRIFAMPADETFPEIEDLRPFGLDHAPGGAHNASFMAKHDDGIAIGNKFVSLKLLKLERPGERLEILLDLFSSAPRMRPGNVARSRQEKFHIVGDETQELRQVAPNERFVGLLHRLKIFLIAHDDSPIERSRTPTVSLTAVSQLTDC